MIKDNVFVVHGTHQADVENKAEFLVGHGYRLVGAPYICGLTDQWTHKLEKAERETRN